jgi:hypothetical protein
LTDMSREIRVEPDTPEAARAEIERTRERISGTLDEIEIALIRKKETLREQVDILARIRARPLEAAGLVLGLGVLLGFLTGGGGGDRDGGRARSEADARAALWEARARRLLSIARGQEEEIDELEDALTDTAARLEEEWSAGSAIEGDLDELYGDVDDELDELDDELDDLDDLDELDDELDPEPGRFGGFRAALSERLGSWLAAEERPDLEVTRVRHFR